MATVWSTAMSHMWWRPVMLQDGASMSGQPPSCRYWAEHKTFRTPDFKDLDTTKPKYYVLDMFPYPSGAGLHVGHPEGYTATGKLQQQGTIARIM
jgi:hypothetical protein